MKEDLSKTIIIAVRKMMEKKLLKEVLSFPVPSHMAIIMDGNRRYARMMGKEPSVGHVMGKNKLNDILDWCKELNIKILTVYAFSSENLKRNKEEVNALMDLFEKSFREAGDDKRVHEYGIRIRAIGDRSILPSRVVKAIEYAEERTKNYSSYFYNIAIGYGGRQEIINAVSR